MNCEQARTQFVDYWRGTLVDSAGEFQTHLGTCERCRAEAEELRDLWGTLGALPEEDPSLAMRTRFYDSLREWRRQESNRRQPLWWLRHPAFQVACAVLILAIGVGTGFLLRGRDSVEVSQLRGEVYNMRQLVALSLMQQQSASDRLRGVNFAYHVEQSDPQVLGALLTTVNHDPNVNVRLAAVDALRKFAGSPQVRGTLDQALVKQDSPLVQIALIDLIVDVHDKGAAPSLLALERSLAVNKDVKERAVWGLAHLQ